MRNKADGFKGWKIVRGFESPPHQNANRCDFLKSTPVSSDHLGAGLGDILRILAGIVSRGRVVADGEGRVGSTSVSKGRAGVGVAADLLGALPDNLSEVTPFLEGRSRVGFAVVRREDWFLVLVHHGGDDFLTDLCLLDTVCDVLSVRDATNGAKEVSDIVLWKQQDQAKLTYHAHRHTSRQLDARYPRVRRTRSYRRRNELCGECCGSPGRTPGKSR